MDTFIGFLVGGLILLVCIGFGHVGRGGYPGDSLRRLGCGVLTFLDAAIDEPGDVGSRARQSGSVHIV